MDITREDLQGLQKSIDMNIETLKWNELDPSHRIHLTILSLVALKESIGKGIRRMEIPFSEERELQIYDKVRKTNVDDLELINYVGVEGWIVKIDTSYEYPYLLEFGNEDISNDWLWSAKNLKLV